MFKKAFITTIAAALLLLSAQVSADKNRQTHSEKNLPVAIIGILASIALPAYQDYTKRGINQALNQHAQIIAKGIKAGRITPKEANKLNNQQKQIRLTKRKLFKNSLTKREAKTLQAALRTSGKAIIKSINNRSTTMGRQLYTYRVKVK